MKKIYEYFKAEKGSYVLTALLKGNLRKKQCARLLICKINIVSTCVKLQ
jgi:hypothetical protein